MLPNPNLLLAQRDSAEVVVLSFANIVDALTEIQVIKNTVLQITDNI